MLEAALIGFHPLSDHHEHIVVYQALGHRSSLIFAFREQGYLIIDSMANRGRTWDPEVFCIKDLKEKASKKLPKMYRGKSRRRLCMEALPGHKN